MNVLGSVITVSILSAILCKNFINAQVLQFGRTELQRQDLNMPGREVVQVLVDIPPGAQYPRHSHPGEEIIYILQGSLEYTIDGRTPVILTTGYVYFIPEGVNHTVRNVGTDKGTELATYIVDKNRPLVSIAK